MQLLFVFLYDYFSKRKRRAFTLFTLLTLAFGWGAAHIRVEEDVSRFFPADKKSEEAIRIFQESRLAEKIVVMVSLRDSTRTNPDSLIAFTSQLADSIARFESAIRSSTYRVDDEVTLHLLKEIERHLPVFLTDEDYRALDSMTTADGIRQGLERSYRQLLSPASVIWKKMIARDPLGINMLAVRKLQQLQFEEGYELVDNYIFTKDHRYLIFFLVPSFPANDTGHNGLLLSRLDNAIAQTRRTHPAVQALYFGAAPMAVSNANQVHRDTVLTITLTVILLCGFLFVFLRKVAAPIIIMIPVAFGALFSLFIIWLLHGSISVLAIAAGSIILGIAVNYSLHFLSHLRHVGSIRDTIKDLVQPMTLGSATTVLAFLSLHFANAPILQDVGLFAGLSLIGASLCTLIFLPHLLTDGFFGTQRNEHEPSLYIRNPQIIKGISWAILIMTPAFMYLATDVSFDSDMTHLSYRSPAMVSAEREMNAINQHALSAVFIVTEGRDLEHALRHNEEIIPKLNSLRDQGIVDRYASPSSFILSDSIQNARIVKWNSYWTNVKKETVTRILRTEGSKLKFSSRIFDRFDSTLNAGYYVPATAVVKDLLLQTFFGDYFIQEPGHARVVSLASVVYGQNENVHKALATLPHTVSLDRRSLTNSLVALVHADFTFIVAFTSGLVFLFLLISYGRIELTLITFVPMLITWIWILGIMALFKIEFNIINVMVSTLVFGLGDDYSIFTMDGLQQEYKMGKAAMQPITFSISLSAITTITGLGVLIFAEHPALKSIAAISIIGIICVFVMSQTLEPFLFSAFISGRAKKKYPPMTLFGFLISVWIYFYFTVGAAVLSILGFLLLRVIPFGRRALRFLYHCSIRLATGSVIYTGFHVKKSILNYKGQYDTPRIIISNHESFLDILLTTMVSPKVLLFTNRWVWRSPIFGGVVRLADYYPIDEGAENSFEKLRDRVAEGYSIMIFPEGSRSGDGHMKRFHKGAFYLAEKLNLDILPLLLHGTGDSVPKGDFYVQSGTLTMKYLSPIPSNDHRFGSNYAERTKAIARYFKDQHSQLARETATPYYFRHRLISTYLYKGPVLEWYLRVKLRLEQYYAPLCEEVPTNAKVLDLGCGYGFLCYMLHFTSSERLILGVDHDAEKLAVANAGYTRGPRLNFIQGDVASFPVERFDIIFLCDVLHYLTPDQQTSLLIRCFEALPNGGKLIVRDGDRDLVNRQRGTALTEFFSVKLLRFNKVDHDLHFISGGELRDLAKKYDMEIRTIGETKYTSNITFVMEKGLGANK